MSDARIDALRAAWTAQPVEEVTMSVEETSHRARTFQRTIARRNLAEYVAIAVVAAWFCYRAAVEPAVLARTGAVLMVVGALIVAWQLHARARTARLPDDATTRACVDFHRRELTRQRDALAGVAWWYVAPIVPGTLLYVVGGAAQSGAGSLAAAIALGTMTAVIACVVALNRKAARRLQEEIDALPTP